MNNEPKNAVSNPIAVANSCVGVGSYFSLAPKPNNNFNITLIT